MVTRSAIVAIKTLGQPEGEKKRQVLGREDLVWFFGSLTEVRAREKERRVRVPRGAGMAWQRG